MMSSFWACSSVAALRFHNSKSWKVGEAFFAYSSLRAKGTLISEPRFSTPCEMRFFPREKGKTAFVEGFSLKSRFPFLTWEKSHLAGGRKSGLTN